MHTFETFNRQPQTHGRIKKKYSITALSVSTLPHSEEVSFRDPLNQLKGKESYKANVEMLSGNSLIGTPGNLKGRDVLWRGNIVVYLISVCYSFSPNSLLWGSLLGKKAGRDMLWPRPGACPPCVRLVSAACPPCVVSFGRASSPCPPLVRHLSGLCLLLVCLVLLTLDAPPVLVRHLSAYSVRALCCLLWPRLQSLSATCPPLVRHYVRVVSATCLPCVLQSLSATCLPLVRHLSATCPPCVRLVLLALAAPSVLVRHLSASCPPCVRLVFLAWTVSSIHVRVVFGLSCWLLSAMCPLYVCRVCALCSWPWPLLQSLSATCPPGVCL